MALTKTTSVIWDNITLTASAADTTSTGLSLLLAYDATLDLKITNGATGPTVAAKIQIQHSPDNTNWYNFGGALSGMTTSAAVTSWALIPLSLTGRYIRLVAGSNTGQNVTVRAEINLVTGV